MLEWGGRLLAFDESQRPYELGANLETIAETVLDDENPDLKFWAHWKLDAVHDQLHLLAIEQGRQMTAHVVSVSRAGQIVARRRYRLPRAVYFHD